MKLDDSALKTLTGLAEKAAIAAGKYIQSQVDQHYKQSKKANMSSLASQVVTEVDVAAQDLILEYLKDSIERFDLGLLTEESDDDASRLTKDYFWCIDPMDGTLAFTEGRSGYSVSIALINQLGRPVIGVVYVPDLQDCYTAIKGQGIQLNGKKYSRTLANDPILHFYVDRSLDAESVFEKMNSRIKTLAQEHFQTTIQQHTGYGAVRNALSVMQSDLACYIKWPKSTKGGGSIWDYAATTLFFEEAGLPVSTASGETLHLNNAETIFMNKVGVVYATDPIYLEWVRNIGL